MNRILRRLTSPQHRTGTAVTGRVQATWNGAVIAESDDTVLLEGNHYFPADSVDQRFLRTSSTSTVCPWKGTAQYYSIVVDGKENADAAWFYPSPTPSADVIQGRVAFWRGAKVVVSP